MKIVMKYSIIIFALLFSACSSDTVEKEAVVSTTQFAGTIELTPEQLTNASLETTILEMGSMPGSLRLYGKIVAAPGSTQQVVFPYGGIIQDLNFQPGSWVTKGQVVARIRNKELLEIQSDYLTTLSSLELLEKDLERQQTLNKENAGSGKSYEQALHAVNSARINLKLLAEKLSLAGIDSEGLNIKSMHAAIEVKSPVTGYVTEVFATNGQFVGPESSLLQVIGSGFRAELTATGSELRYLEPGQTLRIHAEGDTSDLQGIIETISPVTNTENTIKVYCTLSNPGKNIQIGSRLTSELFLRDQEGLLIPTDAIVSWKNTKYIFLKTADATFEMKRIESPTNSNDSMSILHSDFELLKREYVSKNAYTLLMMIANKEE